MPRVLAPLLSWLAVAAALALAAALAPGFGPGPAPAPAPVPLIGDHPPGACPACDAHRAVEAVRRRRGPGRQ